MLGAKELERVRRIKEYVLQQTRAAVQVRAGSAVLHKLLRLPAVETALAERQAVLEHLWWLSLTLEREARVSAAAPGERDPRECRTELEAMVRGLATQLAAVVRLAEQRGCLADPVRRTSIEQATAALEYLESIKEPRR